MILVTGATGTVGRRVVEQLLAADEPVRASTRNPASASLPEGAEVVRGDLGEPDSWPAMLDGVRRLYLFPVPDAVDAFLDTARRAGVGRVVVLSSAAADSDYGLGSTHLAVERAVETTDLEWTHLRPGAFAANALWQWGPSIRAEGVVRAPYGDAATAPIHEADIAAVATAALLGDGHAGHRYELTGPESLTYRDQVAILGDVLGREIGFVELTPPQAREHMAATVPGPVVDGLLALWADAVGRPAAVLPTVEQVTGRPARSFVQWATENVERFR